MTLEELAGWIAGTPGPRLASGSAKWTAVHDRALEALREAYEKGLAATPNPVIDVVNVEVRQPTIAELEVILDGPDENVEIQPDGSIVVMPLPKDIVP